MSLYQDWVIIVIRLVEGYYFLEKRLAFVLYTWYILIPAKKTQFTRYGKQMKNKLRKKLEKRACKVGSEMI